MGASKHSACKAEWRSATGNPAFVLQTSPQGSDSWDTFILFQLRRRRIVDDVVDDDVTCRRRRDVDDVVVQFGSGRLVTLGIRSCHVATRLARPTSDSEDNEDTEYNKAAMARDG